MLASKNMKTSTTSLILAAHPLIVLAEQPLLEYQFGRRKSCIATAAIVLRLGRLIRCRGGCRLVHGHGHHLGYLRERE